MQFSYQTIQKYLVFTGINDEERSLNPVNFLKDCGIQIKPFVIYSYENPLLLDGLIRKLHEATVLSHIFDSPGPGPGREIWTSLRAGPGP